MIKTDIYGKEFSNSFNSKINAPVQRIKPKVLVNFLDTRHCKNLVITTNSPHNSNVEQSLGYYFNTNEVANGWTRESYTWAVCDAKDYDGKTICADGTRYAMPSTKEYNLEFGWWSASVSTSNVHPTYGGYSFAVNPYVEMTFTAQKANLIKVSIPEFTGPIGTYRIIVKSNDVGVTDPLLDQIVTVPDGQYYCEHNLPFDLGHETVYYVKVEVITTKNPLDNARIQEIDVIYQEDLSDYVITYSHTKSRDLHASSLPIAGTDSGSLTLEFDNTSKDFNIFDINSKFGKYMTKDLKMFVTSGWQIVKSKEAIINKKLRSPINSTDLQLYITNIDNLPTGGAGNYFVLEIDHDNENRELVLCSSSQNTYYVTIAQRGFGNTQKRSHAFDASVRFDTFEYTPYIEVFVDEWASSTGSMTISVVTTDLAKYMNEKMYTKGFFVDKSTIPSACEQLLMFTNFPKKQMNLINRFDRTAKSNKAVLHLDFNESTKDRVGNQITVSDGLRARFFAIPDNLPSRVKDITADALDRELTELEKALGETSFIAPDFVTVSPSISDDPNLALNLTTFSFTDFSGEVRSDYFNCVFDGFYIPLETGEQYLGLDIENGGARIYIDDTLVLNQWRSISTAPATPYTMESEHLELVAGKPYKIRIEAFHQTGDFGITLLYAVGNNALSEVSKAQCKTVCAIDKLGSRNSSFTPASIDRNRNRNNAIYLGGGSIGVLGGLVSNPENFCAVFGDTKYARIPYDLSYDLPNVSSPNYTNGKWSIELVVKTTQAYSGNGEYFSNWSNASPTSGIEFFSNSAANGIKLITSSGTVTASSSTALSTTSWSHIFVTCDNSKVYYYVNGEEKANANISGTVSSWTNKDFTISGRGASYTPNTGEVAPSTIRDIYFDELIFYREAFDADFISQRYTEMTMQPMTVYPFLFGNEVSVREIVDEITLADLGRLYIDEVGVAKYEPFNAFFEPSIDQHANVQMILNDDNIISADYSVQLQANKVVVKISGVSSNLAGVQGLWRANDPTTLAVVNLEANISNTSNSMVVSSTTDPPFSKAGYVVIDNEIIKYNNKTPNSFIQLERAQFGTVAASHSANTSVREVRYWDVKYDKAPAFNVKNPFITGIEFESPDEIVILKYEAGPYAAKLVIGASNAVPVGSIIFAEGTNPITEKVAYTAISGIPVVIVEQSDQIQEQSAEISDSIRLNGLKEIVIENRFISDFNHAQKIAKFIINKMSTPVPIINVSSIPTPKNVVGDKIRISSLDAFGIVNGDYWILSKNYVLSDSPSQILLLRKVV